MRRSERLFPGRVYPIDGTRELIINDGSKDRATRDGLYTRANILAWVKSGGLVRLRMPEAAQEAFVKDATRIGEQRKQEFDQRLSESPLEKIEAGLVSLQGKIEKEAIQEGDMIIKDRREGRLINQLHHARMSLREIQIGLRNTVDMAVAERLEQGDAAARDRQVAGEIIAEGKGLGSEIVLAAENREFIKRVVTELVTKGDEAVAGELLGKLDQKSRQEQTGIDHIDQEIAPGVSMQIWQNTKFNENNFDLRISFSRQARVNIALAPLLPPLRPPEVFTEKKAA